MLEQIAWRQAERFRHGRTRHGRCAFDAGKHRGAVDGRFDTLAQLHFSESQFMDIGYHG
jgi:hypothetical protein